MEVVTGMSDCHIISTRHTSSSVSLFLCTGRTRSCRHAPSTATGAFFGTGRIGTPAPGQRIFAPAHGALSRLPLRLPSRFLATSWCDDTTCTPFASCLHHCSHCPQGERHGRGPMPPTVASCISGTCTPAAVRSACAGAAGCVGASASCPM